MLLVWIRLSGSICAGAKCFAKHPANLNILISVSFCELFHTFLVNLVCRGHWVRLSSHTLIFLTLIF